MLDIISNRQKRVIEIFKELSKVPRNSRHEEKIAEYIANFARKQGLDAKVDALYNVVVKKEKNANKNVPPVIFQAHTDMVCQKKNTSNHDFSKDKIEIIEKGNTLIAKDTTLGADDGIGVATLLMLMEEEEIQFPVSYFVFTTQEEIGMYGADYLDMSDIHAKYLINLDGEDEDEAIVGCAGGISTHFRKECRTEDIKEKVWTLEITGAYGGHSGVDIDKGRINTNLLASTIIKDTDSKIISFIGGGKDNAIANYTKVTFENKNDITDDVNNKLKEIKLCKEDENLKVTIKKENSTQEKVMSKKDSDDVLSLITSLKQNVIERNSNNELTSGNIGIVEIEKGKVHIVESIRSSDDLKREEVRLENSEKARKLGYSISDEGAYPGWKYKTNSKLQGMYKEAYIKTHNGKEPKFLNIHAGVECAMFSRKDKELDMISIGPTIKDVHTVNETLYLDTCNMLVKTIYTLITNMN